DVNEFEEAQPGTIQEEFWERFNDSRFMVDPSGDPEAIAEFGSKTLKQQGFWILSNLYTRSVLEMYCKMLDAMKAGTDILGQIYYWIASDPQGKHHTQGLI